VSKKYRMEEKMVVEERIELMVPVSKAGVKEKLMAERLSGLEGKVLGILCNRKHNANLLLERLAEGLKSKYRFSDTLYREKDAASPAPEGTLKELKEKCDLVLNAVGD
jgi:hypothetical protein